VETPGYDVETPGYDVETAQFNSLNGEQNESQTVNQMKVKQWAHLARFFDLRHKRVLRKPHQYIHIHALKIMCGARPAQTNKQQNHLSKQSAAAGATATEQAAAAHMRRHLRDTGKTN
jgi:hypothetical protein